MRDKTEDPLPIPVKAENLWLYCGHGTGRHYTDGGRCLPMRPVTDADLASLGYVKRPACGECDGKGGEPPRWSGQELIEAWECASCGGSGFARLMALDGIDVEALREALLRYRAMASPDEIPDLFADGMVARFAALARQVLAAIDQEDTP